MTGTPARAAPVDHVREGARACDVLLDDAQVRIEHFHRGGEGRTLVVTFDPLLYLWDRPPFGHEFLLKQSLDVVAVRKKTENFYQPLSREAFEAAVGPVAARYRRVVSYGSSLGAYAALYYGRDEPWIVIASSPRNSTHPIYGTLAWQQQQPWQHEAFSPGTTPRCRALILYDPREPTDRRYLDGEVLPQFPEAEVWRVPFSGHPSNQFLVEIGFIAPFVRAVLADEQPERWPRLARRQRRRQSPTYFQVLAQLCLAHGHLDWSEALVQRALALNPNRMLSLRVAGMIALERQRWDDAVDLLQTALSLSPADPLTQFYLRKAQARGEALPLAAPDAVDSPTLATRLRGWWQRLRSNTG